MAPKQKSVVGDVDGVPYILNLASRVVVLGTGLVSNDQRDTFKLSSKSTAPTLEEQARLRPKFKALVAAAKGGATAEIVTAKSATTEPAAGSAQQQEQPRRLCWRHSTSAWAKRQLKRRPSMRLRKRKGNPRSSRNCSDRASTTYPSPQQSTRRFTTLISCGAKICGRRRHAWWTRTCRFKTSLDKNRQ